MEMSQVWEGGVPIKEEKMNLTRRQEESFSDAVLTLNISLENAIEWIKMNMNPGDVFPESELEMWASTSGYIKKEGE